MTLQTIKLNQIKTTKANPRKSFDEKSIEGLAQSILTDGLLQNLTVAKPMTKRGKYTIICGERRFRALSLLVTNGDIDKNYEVNVEVKEDLTEDDILRIATVENVQREDLNPLEEAQAIEILAKEGENLDDIISKTGLSKTTISRRLMLLNLSDNSKTALMENTITLSLAEALSMGTHEQQEDLIDNAINGYSDASDIKDSFFDELPTKSMAIFDTDLYNGEYQSDLLSEDDTTYFSDVDQFMELQRAEALNLVEKHKETADWAELIEGYFPYSQFSEADEGEIGGVIIQFAHDGTVKVHENYIKREVSNDVKEIASKPKATYGAPLIRYMAMHKSIAVQEVLLSNPRILRELALVKKICGFRAHSALPYFSENDETTSKSFDLMNKACVDVLSMFQDVNEDSNWEDLAYLFNCFDETKAYLALKSLSDEQLEDIQGLFTALEFGSKHLDMLDTSELSFFNKVAMDLNVDMRDFWTPDEGFLKRRNKIQLQKIINESGNQKHFHNIDKFKKGEIVKSLGKVFDSAGKVEAPDESQIQTTLWLPEAMSFPAIDPDNANTDSLDENVADYEEDDLEAVA
jgi:ParB family chromosome partitioning protein